MHDGDDIWGFPDDINHGATTSLSRGFFGLNISRVYPMLDPFGGSSFFPEISFTLAQSGGSSETFNPCIMEIHYESNVVICEGGS